MHDELEEILLLQTEFSSLNTPSMQRRGTLIRTGLRDRISPLLPDLAEVSGIDDLRVQGKDGMGRKTEIPWVRIYSAERSPHATNGWYLVYLFSAAGDRVYLSLNQGTTRWNGVAFVPQPEGQLVRRTDWARQVLADRQPPARWRPGLVLDGAVSRLGHGYELGNVLAVEYPLNTIPDERRLADDLMTGAQLLGRLYSSVDEGLYIPGDSPELADAERAIEEVAGRRSRRGFRLSSAERLAIERRAVEVTTGYLQSHGYHVEDVGSRKSYDLHATKDGETLYVEVKGTTSSGSEVVLTRNEVALHREQFPNNALAIVHSIELRRAETVAVGGELSLRRPWLIDDTKLAPLAYSYTTEL